MTPDELAEIRKYLSDGSGDYGGFTDYVVACELLAEVDRRLAAPNRGEPTMADLDPRAIMAEHRSNGVNEDGPGCVECSGVGWADPWPCLPYRLASDLAAEREQTERVRALHDQVFDDETDWCGECGRLWPCLTAEALDGTEQQGTDQ